MKKALFVVFRFRVERRSDACFWVNLNEIAEADTVEDILETEPSSGEEEASDAEDILVVEQGSGSKTELEPWYKSITRVDISISTGKSVNGK